MTMVKIRKSQEGKTGNTTRQTQKSSQQQHQKQKQRSALMGTAAAMLSFASLLLLLLFLVVSSVFQQQPQQLQHSVVDAFSPTQMLMMRQQRKQHRHSQHCFVDHDVFKLRVVSSSSSSTGTTGTEESEVERLLRKARELREQATRDEQQIHSQLVTKKQQHEKHIDGVIDYLFDGIDIIDSSSSTSTSTKKKKKKDQDDKTDDGDSSAPNVDPAVSKAVADRLKSKKVSKDTLEKIVERLDDKLMIAEGKEHVCPTASSASGASDSVDSTSTSQSSVFERVTKPRDSKLMALVENQIDCLLSAVQLLDEEFRNEHASTVTGSDEFGLYSTTATEHTHWGAGHLYDDLTAIVKEKQRERHDQFLKRQQEFIDAQTIKPDQQKDVHKVKDDHGFLP